MAMRWAGNCRLLKKRVLYRHTVCATDKTQRCANMDATGPRRAASLPPTLLGWHIVIVAEKLCPGVDVTRTNNKVYVMF